MKTIAKELVRVAQDLEAALFDDPNPKNKKCPKCNRGMDYNMHTMTYKCLHCGYFERGRSRLSKDIGLHSDCRRVATEVQSGNEAILQLKEVRKELVGILRSGEGISEYFWKNGNWFFRYLGYGIAGAWAEGWDNTSKLLDEVLSFVGVLTSDGASKDLGQLRNYIYGQFRRNHLLKNLRDAITPFVRALEKADKKVFEVGISFKGFGDRLMGVAVAFDEAVWTLLD